MKFTGRTNQNEASIVAQKMAQNTALQYRLGDEDLQRQLMGDDPEVASRDTVGLLNPTQTIRLPKQKQLVSVLSNSKGYNAKEMTQSGVPVIKSSPNAEKAREFIAQTRALDNDLDHAIALMRLNNKDEFYKKGTTGTVNADFYRKYVKEMSEPSQEELTLKTMMVGLLDTYTKAKQAYQRSNDIDEDEEDRLKEMEAEYQGFQNILKEMQEETASNRTVPKNEEILKSLVDKGKTIDVTRHKNNIGDLHKMKEETFFSTLSGENDHRRSKNGLRILNKDEVGNLSSELLLISKKIANGISSLIPLAQIMVTTRYQGITHADKLMLQEMYKDMDEKLYVLTSINNVDNTIFTKLDNSFDKLYDTVKRGLDSYNGGSMRGGSMGFSGPGIHVQPAHTYVNVDNWNYL